MEAEKYECYVKLSAIVSIIVVYKMTILDFVHISGSCFRQANVCSSTETSWRVPDPCSV